MSNKCMVSERRNYTVLTTEDAKRLVAAYLLERGLTAPNLSFGLPEIIDRYHVWNVPVLYQNRVLGEIAVNAYTQKINDALSTDIGLLEIRMQHAEALPAKPIGRAKKSEYTLSPLHSAVYKGRSELILKTLPEQSVDMVFTSPPYFNAKKAYSEFETYDDYLRFMRRTIREIRRVLIDGKFFILNTSHVLIPRASRQESSRRIAVPFDLHQIMLEEGYEFVDDIIWQKPEGAGWASGRGRRFAADRNPMQYKAVPVTEYVMVYRKKPAGLIDAFIRNHPEQRLVQESKIADGYERTNVWYISPARDKRHPAIFPAELAEKVIAYYSFKNDVVLDPFGGLGTTAKAAQKLGRRFVSIEIADAYVAETLKDMRYCADSPRDSGAFAYQDLSYLSADADGAPPVCASDCIAELYRRGYTDSELVAYLKNIR